MVFSSLLFLYLFLPATLLLYVLMPDRGKNLLLLAASLVFYFAGSGRYLFLMLGMILLSYLAGRCLSREDQGFSAAKVEKEDRGPFAAKEEKEDRDLVAAREAQEDRGLVASKDAKRDVSSVTQYRKITLAVFLLIALGLLGFFKYADLVADTINAVGGGEILRPLHLALPIGISFYSFQCISYVVDVYRGTYPAEKNLIRFATYVSFFPQLIAGPIVRYDAVKDALKARKHSFENYSAGVIRFTIGLGKKVLVADRLFAFCAAAAATREPSAVLAWAESAAYLLYVYFDFSGYSDMAIGLGKCFGFDIPENFNYPLISGSIREFWRRWHISLGTWFRDYVYIPMGGSREGRVRHIRNLLIVWGLTGLWHGAGWNFALWGLSFGVLLCLEASIGEKSSLGSRDSMEGKDPMAGKNSQERKAPMERKNPLGKTLPRHLGVLIAAILIFVWFRFPSFELALNQFGKMFTAPLWSGESAYLLKNSVVILLASAIGATPLLHKAWDAITKTRAGRMLSPVLSVCFLVAVLILVTAYLVDGSFSPFLYFRF